MTRCGQETSAPPTRMSAPQVAFDLPDADTSTMVRRVQPVAGAADFQCPALISVNGSPPAQARVVAASPVTTTSTGALASSRTGL